MNAEGRGREAELGQDTIRIQGMVLYGRHGVSDGEQAIGRIFEVDVELALDLSAAGETDDLEATVDYAAVCEVVRRVHEAGPYRLLEAFAQRIAKEIGEQFPVEAVAVRVRKPLPPVGSVVGAVEVGITWTRPRR